MPERILLFIPAYNCEKQILRVIQKINSKILKKVNELLIIDNDSHDATIKSAIKACKKLKLKVNILQNLQNVSLGGSLKRAFLYAIKHKYDYIIILHGDDQADIRDFTPMLYNKTYQKNDMIIGARFHPNSSLKGYSNFRIFGNKCLNTLCQFITNQIVYDLIAGLNCFKVSWLQNKFFLKFPDNLTFDVHLLLYGFSRRTNIIYIPITWREEDQISNAKVLKQAMIILRLFLKYLILGKNVFNQNLSTITHGMRHESRVVFSQNKKLRTVLNDLVPPFNKK